MKSKLFVISGPSGAGKSTICKKILAEDKNLKFSISYTTRSPRTQEIDGVDYFFVDENTFNNMILKNDFAEWAKVHNNFYGTSRKWINENLGDKDIIFDIDVLGAKNIKKIYKDAVLIFISPPNEAMLIDRIKSRHSESKETLNLRLTTAKNEYAQKDIYDYIIINDILDEAVKELKKIINKEREKTNGNTNRN